jgi:hypothetical protein
MTEKAIAVTPSPLRQAWCRIQYLFRRRGPSSLVLHAQRELKAAGFLSKDSPYDGMIGKEVLKLVRTFSDQGHSGMSASLALSVFTKVAMYGVLTPLSGNDDEWVHIREGLWQNSRSSHVFKTESGAYDSEGRIFRDTDGSSYQSIDSRVPITFPYTPHTEYVDRPSE